MEDNNPRYIVGLDLGTTHCAVTYTDADVPEYETPDIHQFEIPQVVSEGEVQARSLLPSFLLLPGDYDVGEGALALPWNHNMRYAVGAFARERGSELPARLVSSAKSWLCHTGVDRTEAILPWESPDGAERISPLDATRRFLDHIRDAWNHRMAPDDPSARLEQQQIFLTVPASFDAVARELTVRAARAAGLEDVTLLEEPQAAFYAWIAAQEDDWRDAIEVGESVLVCDVGGGTTDFSLIQVVEEDGTLDLQRVAVGDHIMLGGDNMDLTLAYSVRHKLAQDGTPLNDWQFRSLTHQCRQAKERLLNEPDLDEAPVVVVGQGSSLIGDTIRTELTRDELQESLLDGFFPHCERTDLPEQKPKVGMREMGLPYASDPAITRHLAQFLQGHVSEDDSDDSVAFPSAVLFNGGVMKADVLRDRVLSVLQHWAGHENVRELPSANLDVAVARGASYYGGARQGRGIRIRAGVPRSYYIGIESAMPTVPGVPTPMKALCVVPFGMEEGTDAQIREKEFGLVVGDDAVFHLLAAPTRKTDDTGDIIEDWSDELDEVATMETHLDASDADERGTVLPVWLESKITEVGTLELWCVARDQDARWKLEFNIREQQEA